VAVGGGGCGFATAKSELVWDWQGEGILREKSVILQPVTIGGILSFLLKLLHRNEKNDIFHVLSDQ
jgi:hypothetical protein